MTLRYTVVTVTAATGSAREQGGDFRRRLLGGLAESIDDVGFRDTTVAEIVRRARTSRRTFYQHFTDREHCLVALLTDTNAQIVRAVAASVDSQAPWQEQVRQAVEAWVAECDAAPGIALTWIRDAPSLGSDLRRLQRRSTDAFAELIQRVGMRGGLDVTREQAIMLLGGLRELVATAAEDGLPVRGIGAAAVRYSVALLRPDGPA